MTGERHSRREYGRSFRRDYEQTIDRIWGGPEAITVDSVDLAAASRDIVALQVMEQELRWIIEYSQNAGDETTDLEADLETIEEINATVRSAR